MAKELAKVRVQIIDADTKLPKEDVDVITSADCVYFPDGKTFQEKWEEGEFQGDPGEDGAAATVRVGSTTTIDPGNKAVVENVGTRSAAILNFSIPKGEKGDPGTSIKIIARFDTYEELVATYPDGSNIDGGFLVGPEKGPCEYYFWDREISMWSSMGSIQGPQGEAGEKGDPGEDGMGLAIFTSVANYSKLIESYPDGSELNGWGILTIDTREYWYWDMIRLAWKSAGCIIGLKGDQGEAGTIKIGEVITSEPGTQASVTNVGDDNNAILNFIIPRGATGDPGKDAELSLDIEVKQDSLNPVTSDAVYNALQSYAVYNHEHPYAGSDNPGGAANSALKCTGNSATATNATNDADGDDITKTYVANITVEDKVIKFLSKDGDVLYELDKSTTYNLPTATEETLGAVKVDNTTISISNGTIYTKNDQKVVASGSYRVSNITTTATITCPSTINSSTAVLIALFHLAGSGVSTTSASEFRTVTKGNSYTLKNPLNGQATLHYFIIGY